MSAVTPGGIDPKYLKLSSLPREGSLSRRDLLFGPLTPRWEVVPAVEAEACTARRGCAECIAVCPQHAIGLDGTAAAIDKARCIGCGACLPACPVGAIGHPSLSPMRLETELRAVLTPAEATCDPRVLLVVADGEPPPDEPGTPRSIDLPSIAAVSPWLLLRAFSLGADAVAVLACPPGCRHRCDHARWQHTHAFTRGALARLGLEAGRLLTVTRGEDLERLSLVPALPCSQRLATRDPAGEILTLASLLGELVSRAPWPATPLAGPEVPFGLLRVQAPRCTLCGACPDRCPTGALSLREDDDSSRLLFDHGRCIACEACVRVCPETAVQVERGLDVSRLGTTAVLAEDEMSRCQRCGAAIAPRRMMIKVGRGLEAFALCAECRIFAS